MWAKPDSMADMMTLKSGHVISGASNAWVPSPTAATLHALHYHDISVRQRQQLVMQQLQQISSIHDYLLKELLTIPIVTGSPLTPEQVTDELRGNIQSILGCRSYHISTQNYNNLIDLFRLHCALGSLGRRLLQSTGHIRRESDGGQGDSAHRRATGPQLARARCHHSLPCAGHSHGDGGHRRPAEQEQSRLHPPAVSARAATLSGPGCGRRTHRHGGLAPQGYTEPVLHKYRLLVKQRGASKL
jgi:malate synthase